VVKNLAEQVTLHSVSSDLRKRNSEQTRFKHKTLRKWRRHPMTLVVHDPMAPGAGSVVCTRVEETGSSLDLRSV
jgi:hypothetical protein